MITIDRPFFKSVELDFAKFWKANSFNKYENTVVNKLLIFKLKYSCN